MNKNNNEAVMGTDSRHGVMETSPADLAGETVLVVIDMQPGYKASQDAITQYFVEQEIIRARERNQPIVVVEFDPHEMGHTYPRLLRHIEGYSRAVVITKRGDDGSKELHEALVRHGFSVYSLRLCGVNSDACVLETIQGFVVRVPSCRVTVPQDACNCLTGKDNDVWYEDYPRIANVTVEYHGQGH